MESTGPGSGASLLVQIPGQAAVSLWNSSGATSPPASQHCWEVKALTIAGGGCWGDALLLLLGRDQRIWGQGHVGVHVCVPVHNWGAGLGGWRSEASESKGAGCGFPGPLDIRVSALGP